MGFRGPHRSYIESSVVQDFRVNHILGSKGRYEKGRFGFTV